MSGPTKRAKKRGRRLVRLLALAGIGAFVARKLLADDDAFTPAPAPRPAPAPAPVAAPVAEAPVAEADPIAVDVPDEPESMIDTGSIPPVSDALAPPVDESPETPTADTIADPEEPPAAAPPADSLSSFFDEVLTEEQETKRGRRR